MLLLTLIEATDYDIIGSFKWLTLLITKTIANDLEENYDIILSEPVTVG